MFPITKKIKWFDRPHSTTSADNSKECNTWVQLLREKDSSSYSFSLVMLGGSKTIVLLPGMGFTGDPKINLGPFR